MGLYSRELVIGRIFANEINGVICPCVSQCLCGLLCLRLRFQMFVWTLSLAIVFLSVCAVVIAALTFLSVCMDFSVFVWALVLCPRLCLIALVVKRRPTAKRLIVQLNRLNFLQFANERSRV